MVSQKKIWVFCFEYAGIAKVGGLGEVSANQCKSLVGEPELDIRVFMPGHGRHRELQTKFGFTPVLKADGTKLVLKGHFDPAYFGLGQSNIITSRTMAKFQSFTDVGSFEIELWQGIIDNVPIYLLVGANPISSRILNDNEVYGMETLNAKLGLFSWAMREYTRYCIHKESELIPDIIHIHDHHPVAALLCCRQELNIVHKDIRSVITMHLLTWPRRDLKFFWKSGVNDESLLVQIGTYRIQRTVSEIYDMCQGDEEIPPTLEKMGCAVADRVIAVSETFLHSDIIPNCGKDVIRWKSDFTWNGCDWSYDSHLESILDSFPEEYSSFNKESIWAWDFRKIFLTKIIGNLPKGEPRIGGLSVKQAVCAEFNSAPYHSNCTVDAFEEDGPMVLITGRVSPQKGVENIFETLPYVIEKIPNVKFLFLMVPTPYSLDDLRNYMAVARKYPTNVRFIFGIAGSIYLLAHLSADVYCCPSRWEPFGIVALEAMASRIPIIATYVGGLQESILHLEDHPKDGTGLLCPNNDVEALKNALVSLLSTMQITEMKAQDPSITTSDIENHLDNIVHPKLKASIKENLSFGEQIRTNALNRVQSKFRWKTVSQKLKRIYMDLEY